VAAGVPFFFKQWGGVRKKQAGREARRANVGRDALWGVARISPAWFTGKPKGSVEFLLDWCESYSRATIRSASHRNQQWGKMPGRSGVPRGVHHEKGHGISIRNCAFAHRRQPRAVSSHSAKGILQPRQEVVVLPIGDALFLVPRQSVVLEASQAISKVLVRMA